MNSLRDTIWKWVPIGTRFFFGHLMMSVNLNRLTELCEKGLLAIGYELILCELVRDPGGWALRIFIDHPSSSVVSPVASAPEQSPLQEGAIPQSTISHEDCKRASQHLSAILDIEDPIPHAYRMEVSSPGVRRPLRKPEHFLRFVGQPIRVLLANPQDRRKNIRGHLVSANLQSIEVRETNSARPTFQIAYENIRRANLDIDF